MFRIQFYNASLLKDICESFEKLYDQFSLKVTPDSFAFTALDSARITILEGELKKETFELFECSNEVNLTIRFDGLGKVLNLADRNDKLVISSKGSLNELEVEYSNEDEMRVGRFKLNLKNDSRIEYNELEPVSFDSFMDLPSHIFLKIISDLFNLDSDIVISMEDGKVDFELGNKFLSESQLRGELMTVATTLRDNTTDAVSSRVAIKSARGVLQKFSSDYLKALSKPAKFFERVKCSMSAMAPMLIEYPVKNSGYIKVYIAPKLI